MYISPNGILKTFDNGEKGTSLFTQFRDVCLVNLKECSHKHAAWRMKRNENVQEQKGDSLSKSKVSKTALLISSPRKL